jgi:hypothetical protein
LRKSCGKNAPTSYSSQRAEWSIAIPRRHGEMPAKNCLKQRARRNDDVNDDSGAADVGIVKDIG